MGTPVVVHEGGGALYETGLPERRRTGLSHRHRAAHRDAADGPRPRLHDELAARGFAMRMGEWSEAEHLDRYLALIGQARAIGRRARSRDRTSWHRGCRSPACTIRAMTWRMNESPAGTTVGAPRILPFHTRICNDWMSRIVSRLAAGGAGPCAGPGRACSVCFGRLAALPSGLIVDGRRPSVDHANPGDPRPVGNDLTFLFLPHHLSIAGDLAVRPLAVLGRPGVRRPPAGRQPAGRDVLSAGLGGLVVRCRFRPRLADGRPSALGRLRCLCLVRSAGQGSGRRRSRPASTRRRRSSWPTPSRAITRTSGRPAGIPGRSGLHPGPDRRVEKLGAWQCPMRRRGLFGTAGAGWRHFCGLLLLPLSWPSLT